MSFTHHLGAVRLHFISSHLISSPVILHQKQLPSSPSERLNMLGVVQSRKAAELLLDVRVDTIFTSPFSRSKATADAICEVRRGVG